MRVSIICNNKRFKITLRFLQENYKAIFILLKLLIIYIKALHFKLMKKMVRSGRNVWMFRRQNLIENKLNQSIEI